MTEANDTRQSTKAERLYRLFTRGFVFVALLVALLGVINSFLQPIWFYENNYYTYQGFYEEPRNSIETVFVGASMTLFGFSPMEMYEQDGICAYNLASSSQPMMASYFWVKEAHRLHSQTLDTVVLDVSMLRRTPTDEDYHRALDGMDDTSPVKDEVISMLTNGPVEAILYRFPLFGYHDRWSTINYTDFVKYDSEPETFYRGYFMEFSRIFEINSPDSIPIPAQLLNPNETAPAFESESLFYLNKLLEYCRDNNIRMVLCKTPSPSNWSSGEHNGVQEIADAYKVDFVDFEFEPLLSEIDYCVPLDSKDTEKHLNYYGAKKLTRWMSTYLAQNCNNRDVRNEPIAERLNVQLTQYHNKITKLADATYAVDVAEYLKDVTSGSGYTVLVTVKDDASGNLTAAQRMAFSHLGLTDLASIQSHDSYLAVIHEGTVEFEQLNRAPSWFEKNVGAYTEANGLSGNEDADVRDTIEAVEAGEWNDIEGDQPPITHKGVFADGVSYTLTSGGILSGNTGSCLIDSVEYAKDSRGINIVVYDNSSHRVVDSAVFDTCLSSERTSLDYETALNEALEEGTRYSGLSKQLQRLYRYQMRYAYSYEAKSLKQEIGAGGLYRYLDNFSRNGLTVLVAVKDDAVSGLSDDERKALSSLGLTGFASLEPQGSYCAVIENGQVSAEENGGPSNSASIERTGFTVESGGYWAGNYASIVIDQDGYPYNYSPNSRGVNVVVYNPKLDIIVDTACFDTSSNGIDL